MDDYLHTILNENLDRLDPTIKQQALTSLESGKVVYLPNHFFSMLPNERRLLTESVLDPKHKNISYDYRRQRVAGLIKADLQSTVSTTMQQFMHRYAEFSKQLLDTLIPQYSTALVWGRTSYRPAEIKGRVSSKRKDDTRVHVDSFSATPVNGLRILRIFCNINPNGEPRIWHLGESFSNVLKTLSPRIRPYSAIRAQLLKLIKATKTLRTPYDHYMLGLHDTMKLDDEYQETLTKRCVEFPPHSTWLVFTDHVSHAALSGQFLLEQTFYLPVNAMANPDLSPLKQWEREKTCVMV